ncbi:hypothetical protein Tco_0129479 [Tanacetum coccineum]
MILCLTIFLGFQIKKSKRGISINKERYVKHLLKKYDKIGSSVKTSVVPPNMLGPDLNDKAVNETQYKGMIGSLMYLTASRLDIQFSTCFYARYQANSKESHLIYVKRIFRYLKEKAPQRLHEPGVVLRCRGACTDLHVLANQTQSISEGLETVLNQSTSDKGASNIAKQIKEVEASSIIKLEDLEKLV